MPEDDVDAFDLFVRWIYSGTIQLDKPPAGALKASVSKRCEYWTRVMRLFILADKLDAKRLKNDAMGNMEYTCRANTAISWLVVTRLLYTELPENCVLRSFILDLAMDVFAVGWVERETNRVAMSSFPQLGVNLVSRLSRQVANPKEKLLSDDKCAYHDHSALEAKGRGGGVCGVGEGGFGNQVGTGEACEGG